MDKYWFLYKGFVRQVNVAGWLAVKFWLLKLSVTYSVFNTGLRAVTFLVPVIKVQLQNMQIFKPLCTITVHQVVAKHFTLSAHLTQ